MSVLILIVIVEALLTSLLPYTKGWFFSSLESRILIYPMLGYMILNSFSLDFIQSIKGYFVTSFALKSRSSLTQSLIDKEHNPELDNIPQRIQEDVKLMYYNKYKVFVEYWISGLILLVIILTNMVHYWLILGALCYAIISVAIAYCFNGRMCIAESDVQRSEADYRKWHTNFSYLRLCNIYCLRSARVTLEYTLFTKMQSAVLLGLPYLFLLPGYIVGTISFGDLVKISTMFQLIVVNADILIAIYPTLIISRASEKRVKELNIGDHHGQEETIKDRSFKETR